MWAKEGVRRRGSVAGVERYGRGEVLWGGCIDHEAYEARNVSVTRHTSNERGGRRELFEMGKRVHAAAIDSLGGERSWI